MAAILERTTKEDQKIARTSLGKIHEASAKIRRGRQKSVTIKVQDKNDTFTVPKKALVLLFDILSNMADGKSIVLMLSDAELSTQQAADILNVSRPHIVHLVEKGEIPHKKVGTHRRIALNDLIDYQNKLEKTRAENLEFLATQAQELNLGYE
jgi:excisionase family DNA binding protein